MGECWNMEGGGTLSLEEEGLRVHLRAVCPDDGRGLYKVWVRGRGGSLLLGTLTPENGRLALSRTLSRSTLGQAGCWPVTGGNTVLVFPFTEQSEEGEPWRPEPDPARLCRDPLLRALLRGGPASSAGRRGRRACWQPPFPIKRNFRCRCCSVWPRWRNGRGGAGWCGALTGRGTRWSRRIAGTGRDILGG